MSEHTSAAFYLDHWARQSPEKTAVQTENRSISYGKLHESASCLAAVIQKLGLKAGDHIMIFMPDCIEYFIVFYAAAKLGLNIVPANALYKVVEIRQLIWQNQPKLAFVKDDSQMQLVRAVDSALLVIRACLDDASFEKTLHAENPVSGFPADLEGFGIRISTSGSTGRLKFVARTFQRQITPAIAFTKAMRLTREDVVLIPVPLPQQFGMVSMLGCCAVGCTMFIPTHFKSKHILSLLETHRITAQYCVPTMYAKEMEAYEAAEPKPELSALRVGMVAGAGCPTELIRWFDTRLNCRVLNCYGATEVAGVTMVDYDDPPQARCNTSGRPILGSVIEIVDGDGKPLPAGGIGEIVCGAPNVMLGYVREPELTAQALDAQNRFWSGDLGKLDEDGYLVVCGRKKDMIIRGGYNVFPEEVEVELLHQPDIAEACVMGHTDALLGERICAFVRLSAGAARDQESIRRRMEAHIAKYKLPDDMIFMEEIPTLANGKYDRPALRALLQERYAPK